MAAEPLGRSPTRTNPPEVLDERRAAEFLGISARTLWARRREGAIPHIRLGGRVLYPLQQLREWMANKSQGGTR